jgi:two-component system, NtrC family, sensor kinase
MKTLSVIGRSVLIVLTSFCFFNGCLFGQSVLKDTAQIDQLYNLSKKYWNTGHDSALYYLRQVEALSGRIKYKRGEAYALYGYGMLEPVLYKRFQYFTQSLALFETIHDKFGIGLNLIKIGSVYNQIGQKEKALEYYKQSLAVKMEIDDFGGIALALINIGHYYQDTGNLQEALQYFEKSLVYRLKEGTAQGIAYSQVNIGMVLFKQDKFDQALVMADSSINNFLQTSDLAGQIWSLYLKGKTLQKLGRPTEAEKVFCLIVEYPARVQYLNNALLAKKELIDLYATRGDIQKAFQLQREYLIAKDTLTKRDYRIETQRLVNEHEFKQQQAVEQEEEKYKSSIRTVVFLSSLSIFLLIGTILFVNNRKKQKTNVILTQSLNNLKATQSQLIQSEKMASLGELTAGIAHEIQNPLNFVNNFSEINTELIDELKKELAVGNRHSDSYRKAEEIANDIKENEAKINHHGKRADAIVKGMLQHSRSSSGQRELTDINALCDEYLRLSYHGLRAKDKSFNAKFKTDFDSSLPKMNVVPQDIGRVVLNLINNAFYAVTEKMKRETADVKGDSSHVSPLTSHYEPTVIVSSRKVHDKIEISVKDNGNGIPDSIKEKIFQPFFTTKPTGQGTGLGLSLSYDIVKAHGGELMVETKEGEGSEFIILLPLV